MEMLNMALIPLIISKQCELQMEHCHLVQKVVLYQQHLSFRLIR